MLNRNQLNNFIESPYKQIIANLGIKQFDLAHSIGIHQSQLSRMLNGIEPITQQIEQEIESILNQFSIQKKHKPIRKQ